MKILFYMSRLGFLRHFENCLRELDRRGHRVHLGYGGRDQFNESARLLELAYELRGLSHAEQVRPESDSPEFQQRQRLAASLRASRDMLHYLDPAFDAAPDLRQRVIRRAPPLLRSLNWLPGPAARAAGRLADRRLARLEAGVPFQHWRADIEFHRPDLVLITPYCWFASAEVDILRAARAAGVPVAVPVASWDHLTTKGRFHEQPDRLLVWNETQRREAVELHGLDDARIRVTGAHCYDHWFDQQPSERRAFVAGAGLDPDRPYLCYLGSSKFIAPSEDVFIERWLRHLRASGNPAIRELGIMLRPHPQNPLERWSDLAAEFEQVAVFPEGGVNPVFDDGRQQLFDSLYHGVASAGLNTSAMIESAVVGRPVFGFHGERDGRPATLHERYLTDAEDGLVLSAANLEEHERQLAALLYDGDAARERTARFTEHFVRPAGLDRSASAALVDALEQVVEQRQQASTGDQPASDVAAFERLAQRYGRSRTVRMLTRAKGQRTRAPTARRQQGPVYGDIEQHASIQAARNLAARLGDGGKPVVAGPWLGEVGYELLYWIPFLRWLCRTGGIDPSRLWAVSRGGVRHWYGDTSDHYVELLDLYTPTELFSLNQQRIDRHPSRAQKQSTLSEADLGIVERVMATAGIEDVELLHPSTLYELLRPWLRRYAHSGFVEQITLFEPLRDVPEPTAGLDLPDDYVAVKFYASPVLPLNDASRSRVASLLERLSAHSPVLVLDPGLLYDEHRMFDLTGTNNIVTLDGMSDPARNLAVQSAAVAGARMLVGTYGGFSYLGPLLGTPAFGVYSVPDYNSGHLALAEQVFKQPGYGPLSVLHIDAMERLVDSLAGTRETASGRKLASAL